MGRDCAGAFGGRTGQPADPAGASRVAPFVVAVAARLRISKALSLGYVGKADLILDVLNLLNDTAGEALASDNLFSATLGRPTQFMDPRRVMFGVRLNLGR
jgi:hypothetical protein